MTTYYIDANRGNDASAGTSPATAWQNLAKIPAVVAAAGDRFLIADDSEFTFGLASTLTPPTSWAGTDADPVVISAYTPAGQSAGRPYIEQYVDIQANEWTYSAPNNAWSYTAARTVGNLCYVKLAAGWGASRTDDGLPLASVDGRYHNSASTFYLYAPAGTDPTTYYGSVRLGVSAGYLIVSSARNSVLVEKIGFREIGCGVLAYSNNATPTSIVLSDITASNCGDIIRLFAETSNGSLYATIEGCNISEAGSAAITAYTSDGLGFKSVKIRNNTITDCIRTYSQGAIYLQCRSPNFQARVYGNTLSRIAYGTAGKTSDGAAIYAEVGADDVLVYGNTISDCHLALQDNSGRKASFFSNVIFGCKSAISVSDQSAVGSTDHRFFNNTCIVGASVAARAGAGTDFNGWRGYKTSGTTMALSLYNNTIVDASSDSTLAAYFTPQIGWSGAIKNNCSVGFQNVAKQQYGGAVQTSTGDVSADPLLRADYSIAPSSPCAGAGLFVDVPGAVDATGGAFAVPPSIGAFEVKESVTRSQDETRSQSPTRAQR